MILHSADSFPGTHRGSNWRMGVQDNVETGVHSHAINNTQVLPFTPCIQIRSMFPLLRGHSLFQYITEEILFSGCLFFLNKKEHIELLQVLSSVF